MMSRTAAIVRSGASGRHWTRVIVGVLVSVAALMVVLRDFDGAQLASALQHAHWYWIAAGIASLAIGYALRIRRWAAILANDASVLSFRACAAPFLASLALNNVMPLRAGDFVRALVFPRAIGISRARATASLILERLLDVVTILLALAIAVCFGPGESLPAWIATSAVVLAVMATVLMGLIFILGHAVGDRMHASDGVATGLRAGWMRAFRDMVRTLRDTLRPGVFGGLLLLSAAAWIAEAGLYWAVSMALGLGFGFFSALFVCAVAVLSTLIPSAPGYIGTFHLAVYSAVLGVTGDPSGALSFALVSHLAFWVPTTAVGAWIMIRDPGLWRAAATGSLVRP